MGQAILGLITVGVMIYALVDCWRSDDREVRGMPRPLWFLVILVPIVGPVAWLVYGAPRGPGAGGSRGVPRVVAPDDDPDFLRDLEQKSRERRRTEREERRRQSKEQRREEKDHRHDGSHDGSKGDQPTPE